jgi:hypothetical protein
VLYQNSSYRLCMVGICQGRMKLKHKSLSEFSVRRSHGIRKNRHLQVVQKRFSEGHKHFGSECASVKIAKLRSHVLELCSFIHCDKYSVSPHVIG